MQDDKSINKAAIMGLALTVILSISGAAFTVNSRVYELEKQLEIVKVEAMNTKIKVEAQEQTINSIYEMVIRIDKNVTKLTGDLNLKADKKFE